MFRGDMPQLWYPSSLPKGLLATSHPEGCAFLVCPAQPGFDAPPCPAQPSLPGPAGGCSSSLTAWLRLGSSLLVLGVEMVQPAVDLL